MLVNCIILRLLFVVLLLLIVLVNHESVSLEVTLLRCLEAKILLNKGLIHRLKFLLANWLSIHHLLVQYFEDQNL